MSSHDVPGADHGQPAKRAKRVFFDRTDLHWCPDVGRSDVPQGSQLKIDRPGARNPWYALFGSLGYPDGTGVSPIHERTRHQDVQARLELLIDSEPDTCWGVIRDHASAHTTPQSEELWAPHRERLGRIPLPTSSPHLNLIERLWRVMRGQMTRHQFYQRLKELAEAIVDWLETRPFSQCCSLLGIDETQRRFV